MPRCKAVFVWETTDISRRHSGFPLVGSQVYLFLRLGCLTFVFCFVVFVGLFVAIVLFFREGGDFLANARCNGVKKHWSCLEKLDTDASFKRYMFDCAETPYTISLNFIRLHAITSSITPSNRMKFRLLTRCGNGINLTRQSISWCSWRRKHCLRALWL